MNTYNVALQQQQYTGGTTHPGELLGAVSITAKNMHLKTSKNTSAKVADFVLLGALSDPGAPDSDLGRFQVRAGWLAGWRAGDTVKHRNCNTCTRTEPILQTQPTLRPESGIKIPTTMSHDTRTQTILERTGQK